MKRLFTVLFGIAALLLFSVTASAVYEAEDETVKAKPAEYVFAVFSNEEAEEISTRIAGSTEFWPTYNEDGTSTMWIVVRITDNPELANIYVFGKTVVKMVNQARQVTGDYYWNSDSVYLMGYNRVAGELAFHVALVMLLETLEPVTNGYFDGWHERFDYAEINIDETRIPPFIMNWTGDIIMDILPFVFLKK